MGKGITEILYIVVFKEARQTESLMRKGVKSNFKTFSCTLQLCYMKILKKSGQCLFSLKML